MLDTIPEVPEAHKTFTEALRIETATLQATYPALADGIGRAHALILNGAVFPEEDGQTAMVRSRSNPQHWHHVNGSCECDAQPFHKQACAHRLALRLYQCSVERLTRPARAIEEGGHTIDPRWLTYIQATPFIRFEGLLALAYERGLVELTTTVVMVTTDFAVCQSTARFKDGLVCTDIGDASPRNVEKHLEHAFPRMAATRASARALRRALNINTVALEELGAHEEDGA